MTKTVNIKVSTEFKNIQLKNTAGEALSFDVLARKKNILVKSDEKKLLKIPINIIISMN